MHFMVQKVILTSLKPFFCQKPKVARPLVKPEVSPLVTLTKMNGLYRIYTSHSQNVYRGEGHHTLIS